MKMVWLRGLFLSVLLVGTGYVAALVPAIPRDGAAWLVAVGTAGSLVSAIAIGATKEGRLGPLGPVLVALFAVLVGGLGGSLLLGPPGEGGADSGLFLGLPPASALVVYGLGLVPVLLVPLAYALTFHRSSVSEREWRKLKALADRIGARDVSSTESGAAGPSEAGGAEE